MSDFSFIIPVYNEEQTIEKVVSDIKKKCAEINDINEYEILIIDDNSTDNSNQIISKLDNVKYFKNLNNFGYGFSLKKGIRKSKYSNIIILDGDGTYPIEYLDKLVDEYNKGYDLVIGKRTGKNLNLSPLQKRVGDLAAEHRRANNAEMPKTEAGPKVSASQKRRTKGWTFF